MKIPRWLERVWPIVPLLAALLFITLLILIFDADPGESFSAMWRGAFGSQKKILNTIAFWVPLTLCALGLLVTFTAGLWNIGVEGQMTLGAVAASWVALKLDAPGYVLIPAEILMAMAAGALWAAIAGALKTRGRVHEIFGGLALNSLTKILILYLILGPWHPESGGSNATDPFQEAALLPFFGDSKFSPLTLGLTLLAFGLVYVALKNSFWGLKLKALGKNARSAFLLGVSSERETILAMMFCGALAGLGGAVRVLGWFDTPNLRPNIAGGIGYLALLVVMLAAYRIGWVPFIAFFFAAVLTGSNTMHTLTGLDPALGGIITGVLVLLTLLFGDAGKLGLARKEALNE